MSYLMRKISPAIVPLCGTLAFCLFVAATFAAPKSASPAASPETFKPLVPGPNDPRIAYWTAQFMENRQYSLQLLDTTMSEKFYDGYLGTLEAELFP